MNGGRAIQTFSIGGCRLSLAVETAGGTGYGVRDVHVCRSGMHFLTVAPPADFTEYAFEFHWDELGGAAPVERRVRCRGIVVDATPEEREYRVCIHFAGMSGEAQELLAGWLARNGIG
jgi:hypothetical protein